MRLTQAQSFVANRIIRAADGLYLQGNQKHNHAKDFGYPATVDHAATRALYERNGFAAGLVEKTVGKTWQSHPELWESEPISAKDRKETPAERGLKSHLRRIRFWQALMEADRRALASDYAAVLLRFKDGGKWSDPAAGARGFDGLIEAIPAWQSDIKVTKWVDDRKAVDYGKPAMFQYDEVPVDGGPAMSIEVHPSRVVIWSRDGGMSGPSKLKSCYNALLDMEKIRGAGGEGFWKNAKSQPVLQAQPDIDMSALASMLGLQSVGEVPDKLDDVVSQWSAGFDASLLLQGIDAKTLQVTLPSPEHFFNIAVQEVAASWPIPQKILVGMQTGERASTEDASEWAQTCMSRRSNEVMPNILEVVDKLVAAGVMFASDWHIDWADLTTPSRAEKFDIIAKMADINAKMAATGTVVFTDDEMRDEVDLEPLTGDEGFTEDMGGDDETTDDTAQQDEPGRAGGQNQEGA